MIKTRDVLEYRNSYNSRLAVLRKYDGAADPSGRARDRRARSGTGEGDRSVKPPSTPTDPREVVTRRGFLGASGVVGIAAFLGGDVRGANRESIRKAPADLSFPEDAHDHAAAGAGGETVRPTDLTSANTPVVNVSAHGVVGDGETDDADAFQAAADAATPHGVLYVPADVDLHFASPIDIDLGASHHDHVPFGFVCDGTLRPAAGLGDAVTIRNGGFIYVRARVAGGGAPGDSAVIVQQSYWSRVEGVAADYDGTAFEMRWIESGGQTWGIGTMQGIGCGRTLLVNRCGGVGQIDSLVDINNRELSRLHQPVDMSVDSYLGIAGDRTETGFTIQSPLSLWIDSLQVRGTSDLDNVSIRSPKYARVGTIESTGGDRGVVVTGAEVTSLDRVLARDNRIGMVLGPSGRARATVDASDNQEAGLHVTQVRGPGNRVIGRICDNGAPVRIRDVTGSLTLSDITVTGNDGPSPDSAERVHGSGGPVQLVIEDELQGVLPPEVRFFEAHVPVIDGTPHTYNRVTEVEDVEAFDPPDYLTLGPAWDVGDRVRFGEAVYLRGSNQRWWRIDA